MFLSIIIPAYNAEKTLGEALDSICAQQTLGGEVEIFVVDDASTDGTTRVAEEWGRCHPDWTDRLCVLHNPGNLGPAASRNQGLRLARADWIAFLDADDIWKPDRLKIGWELAQRHPEIDLWTGTVVPVSETAELAILKIPNPQPVSEAGDMPNWREIDLEELAFHNPVATSAVLVKRQALVETGGFDTALRGPEDYDLWLRLAVKHRLAAIDWPLSYYRQRPGSLSLDDRKFLPQIIKVFEKAYGPDGALYRKHNRRVSLAWQMLMGAWMASEHQAQGRAWLWFFKAVWLWPWPLPCQGRYHWPRLKLMKTLIWRYFRVAATRK